LNHAVAVAEGVADHLAFAEDALRFVHGEALLVLAREVQQGGLIRQLNGGDIHGGPFRGSLGRGAESRPPGAALAGAAAAARCASGPAGPAAAPAAGGR